MIYLQIREVKICNKGYIIMNGVDNNIISWPAKDEFRLFTHPDGLKCKSVLKDTYLSECKMVIDGSVMVGHDEGLEIIKCNIHFKRKQ